VNNKALNPDVMTDNEVKAFFEIDGHVGSSAIKVCKVVSCCSVSGLGLKLGVDWLSDKLEENSKQDSQHP